MRGVRYALRQYTAMAVKEHLRSAMERPDGPAELTKNEIELVRFVRDGRIDWDAYLAGRA